MGCYTNKATHTLANSKAIVKSEEETVSFILFDLLTRVSVSKFLENNDFDCSV